MIGITQLLLIIIISLPAYIGVFVNLLTQMSYNFIMITYNQDEKIDNPYKKYEQKIIKSKFRMICFPNIQLKCAICSVLR